MTKRTGDTKAAMADALRECMLDTPIDKISIKSITDKCGLNRQTFYYHFRDIYDLVKWAYVRDIKAATDDIADAGSWESAMYQLLMAFEKERDSHLAIYNSRNYYPTLRQEIIDSLTEQVGPVFKGYFDELGFDATYREFLLRMYALVVFEYIERRARGYAFSTPDGFVHSWFRTVRSQFEGERAAAELAG